jgi:glycosyltransferase involved in cell wall biosynthesis
MLRAIQLAKVALPNLKLEIVYPNEWLNEEITFEISQARKIGIPINLRRLVTDKELFELYNSSSLLLFCSLAEGLGLPPLEARAFSLPTIVSNFDAMGELEHLGGAEGVNPFDINEISNGLIRVLGNFSYWQRLKEGSKNQLGLPWDSFSSQFLRLGDNYDES